MMSIALKKVDFSAGQISTYTRILIREIFEFSENFIFLEKHCIYFLILND